MLGASAPSEPSAREASTVARWASRAACHTLSWFVEAIVLLIVAWIGDRDQVDDVAVSIVCCDVALQQGTAEGLLPL